MNPSHNSLRTPLVVLLCVVFTALAWFAVSRSIDYFNIARFDRHVDELRSSIDFQMETYLNALVQTKSTFDVAGDFNRDEFRRYIDNLRLLDQYPGIQGIGYSVRLTPAELDEHIEQVRQAGFPDYTVWPATERDEYFSIVYLEPFDWRNQRAFGFDMYTQPTRRAAMIAARDSGMAAASGKVTLVQETDIRRQPGLLMYVPFYQPGMPTGTVEERRAALEGFIYSPFRAHDLLRGILRTSSNTLHNVDFEVYDGRGANPDNLLYDHNGEASADGRDSPMRETFELEIAGRPWTVVVSPLPAFFGAWERALPLLVLAAGALITGLLLLTLRSNDKELAAVKRTALLADELASEREVLQTVNEVGRNVAAELDFDKLVQSIIDAATRLSKAQFGALFYNVETDEGGAFSLYAISGVPREVFSKFPMPRNTRVFSPTFKAERVVRSDDITKEDTYGKNPPYHGMPKGHLPVVSYLAVPVVSRSGEVFGGLFFGHSEPGVFTEREEKIVVGIAAQAAIAIDNARLYQRAQQAVALRDEFLSIASHEFKTPISTVKMQLQVFRHLLASSPTASAANDMFNKGLAACERQVARLTELVENLLDVTQIEAGKLSFQFEATDLVQLTQSIVDNLTLSHGVPPCHVAVTVEGPLMVNCDRFRVEQVITNLLTNAVKYGEDKPIDVIIEQSAVGDMAIVRVRDRGMGIEPSNQEKIFERFHRAISLRNISGLGLGLYISKQIIAAHDGRIEVQSQPGAGSTFTIYLPLMEHHVARLASA